MFLRSLTPAEELASFLDQRANCLEDYAATDFNFLDEAWACYAKAVELSHYNWVYRSFAMTVHRKKLALALMRWGWSPEQYLRAVQDRFNGLPNLYPWEIDIGQPPANLVSALTHFRKPPPGFNWQETAAILDPIAAVEQVFANRLGTSRIAPSRFPPGAFGSQAFRYPDYSIPLNPVHELCVFTGEPSPNPGRFVGSRGRSNTALKGEPPPQQRAT